MDEKDIIRAPSDIMFFTWLYKLMAEDHAKFNEENENIIDLDTLASSWFVIGRDNDTLKGFLGVPKAFIPWFPQIKFKHAVVDFTRNRLYISCGDANTEGVTIGLKVRPQRLALLWHDNFSKDSTQGLDFRIFGIKADKQLEISENPIKELSLIHSDDLRKVVQKSMAQESLESVYADDIKSRYEDMFANKYSGVSNSNEDLEI